jgi:hypothetical protein
MPLLSQSLPPGKVAALDCTRKAAKHNHRGHGAAEPQPKKNQQQQLTRIYTDLADERGSSKCSAIRVIRYISVNPRGLLVFGFVSPLCFLKSSVAAKTLQASSTEEHRG